MIIIGYLGAVLIGVVLGMLGGGGSILTLPILVYLMGVDPITATAYSLFIVGVTSLIGTVRNTKKGNVDYKTGLVFAVPAFISVFLTRKYLVPALPETFLDISIITISKEMGIMIFFALIMLIAGGLMIKGRKDKNEADSNPQSFKDLNILAVTAEGIIVGLLTGIVGAGGGFLIIPALVLLAKLPMKKAVATSLFIIAVKSLIGFLGDVSNLSIDWFFLTFFTLLSIVGIIIGIYLNQFIDEKKLKKAFGWFVLVMAVIIVLKELL